MASLYRLSTCVSAEQVSTVIEPRASRWAHGARAGLQCGIRTVSLAYEEEDYGGQQRQ